MRSAPNPLGLASKRGATGLPATPQEGGVVGPPTDGLFLGEHVPVPPPLHPLFHEVPTCCQDGTSSVMSWKSSGAHGS